MKGILMFDNLNDLVFFEADEELTQHVKNLAMKDGLLEDLSFRNSTDVVDVNVVMQLFSPLIASYKVMQAQFGNRYRSIESEDGTLLIFDEVLNYIVIGISSTEEKEEDVLQEISFFLVLVKMLYGPSLQMIKYDIATCCRKCTRSELLSRILREWRLLKMEQQMFLVEAVERLLINEEITAMCINLLQEVLEKVRSTSKEGSYCHSFALVDTKLLALYSSRNSGQLPKETLLLLILVAQVLRTSNVSLEQIIQSEQLKAEEQFFVPISNATKAEIASYERKINGQDKNKSRDPAISKSSKLKAGAQSLLVYLNTHTGIHVPHVLYLVEVTHRINLIILYEMTAQGTMSSSISSVVKTLYNLQSHPAARTPLKSFENLERDFKILMDSMWKLKVELNEEKEKYMKKLIGKWEQLKQREVETFMDESKDKSVDPCLDSTISSLCEMLRSAFEDILAVPCLQYEEKTWSPDHQDIFKAIQNFSIRKMKDTADYLEVKALQNITMTSYPLSHFDTYV